MFFRKSGVAKVLVSLLLSKSFINFYFFLLACEEYGDLKYWIKIFKSTSCRGRNCHFAEMESRYYRGSDRKAGPPHWKGRGRGTKLNWIQELSANEEHVSQRVLHPVGLRGREIGLWYAQRNKGKRKNTARNEECKNRAVILLDSYQEHQISCLLRNIRSLETVPPTQNETGYHIDQYNDDNDGNTSCAAMKSNHSCEKKTSIDFPNSSAADFNYLEKESLCLTPLNEDCMGIKKKSYNLKPGASALATDLWTVESGSENDADDIDAELKFDEEQDDVYSGDFMSNFNCASSIGETADIEFEEESKDGDETEPDLLYYNSEEKEISDFSIELFKDLKEKKMQCSEHQNFCCLVQNKEHDQVLLSQLKAKEKDDAYQRMLQWRHKLPCFHKKQEILDAVNNNKVIVISGETGCGKTTQVTQYILDSWIKKGSGSLCHLICTQPRRLSAISVAERVADERCEPLGASVGYQIRLEQKYPCKQGSILYCTTGILLKRLESDPWLTTASHIILDEVHERDILSDFLMIILRDLLQQRCDLKLILMSATVNANLFSTYFGICPVIYVPGNIFPVKEYFLEDIIEMICFMPSEARKKKRSFHFGHSNKKELQELNEYQCWIERLDSRKYSQITTNVLQNMNLNTKDIDYDLVTALIRFIILNRTDGAILVFVPGWEQIRKVMDNIRCDPFLMSMSSNLQLIPLHSLMPTVNQKEIFQRSPQGKKKIVISTNIAETSITIDDVVYVIDSGTVKMKKFDVSNNLSTLQPEWISQANAKQRRGRAGRVCPGECFHLYTTFHETQFNEYQEPEILRTRLEELCLQIKLLKLGKIQEFVSKAMQPPSSDSLQQAINTLKDLNALDAEEELTPLGYHLAKMPVDPHLGKMLLFGAIFSCLDPILTIAASLSFKDAFYVPMGHEKIADERKRQLANNTKSDHLLLVNAYEGWERAKENRNVFAYCRHNYLSTNTLQMLHKMRLQFSQLLFDMGFTVNAEPKSPSSNRNAGNLNLVKAVVCAGLYPNIARLEPIKNIHSKRPLILCTQHDQKVYVHPKSVSFTEREFSSQWFTFHLQMRTNKTYLYDCSPVSPYSLLFFGSKITCKKDMGQNCLVVDDWINFRASRRDATLLQELRQEFDRLMDKKILNPSSTNWKRDSLEDALMHAILKLLTE